MWCTEPPAGGFRDDDHYDYAWQKLGEGLIQALGDVAYIAEADISHGRVNLEERAYVLSGYPQSKNKKAKYQRRLQPQLLGNFSLLHPARKLLKELELTGHEHVTIGHGERSVNELGMVKNSVHPRGPSDGPLFDLGCVQDPDRWGRAKVFAGVLAGYHADYDALLCVKFNDIKASIQEKDKEVRRSRRLSVGR